MHTRTVGGTLAVAAAILALRPVAPLERLADLFVIPARLAAPAGLPVQALASVAGARDPEATIAAEAALSLRLERAVLESAIPRLEGLLQPGVVPIPGEVDARVGRNRDRISVRVADPEPIVAGQPVVAGDVYLGTVERVHARDVLPGGASLFDRVLVRLGLQAPPAAPERDLIVVRLITDPAARVGGSLALAPEEPARRLVVGGLVPDVERVWLAVHNPESRTIRSGTVRVLEPVGVVDSFDKLAEGFRIGELGLETIQWRGRTVGRDVLFVEPSADFEAGLNQVLVLTDGSRGGVTPAAGPEVVPVLEATGWARARATSIGDVSAWRRTARIDRGRSAGVRRGAAVIDGVRLAGRVIRADRLGASVALLDDPGFRVNGIAQSVIDPDATPLVLGDLVSSGRDGAGRMRLRWSPRPGNAQRAWLERHGREVRIWTGSGMERVPRGLLVGRTSLSLDVPPEPSAGEAHAPTLTLEDTGDPSARLAVRVRGAHLERSDERARDGGARSGLVEASERAAGGDR